MTERRSAPLPPGLREAFPGCRSLICVAVRLEPLVTDREYSVAFSGLAPDYHGQVTEACRAAAAGAVLCDHVPFSEKELAARAGLGFVARNGLLWSDSMEAFPYLGEVVSEDPPGDPPGPAPLRRCPVGGCPGTPCSACPALAGGFRRELCVSHITQKGGPFSREETERIGARLYGCDDCQTGCVMYRRTPRVTPMPPLEYWIDLSREEYARVRGRYPFLWIGRNRVRRNALCVACNLGLPDAKERVGRALGDPSATVSRTAEALMERIQ